MTDTDGLKQIPESVLQTAAEGVLESFGAWKNSLPELRQSFTSKTYQHVIIDGFFTEDLAYRLLEVWPKLDEFPQLYHNPFEQRQYVHNDVSVLQSAYPVIAQTLHELHSPNFISLMKAITGIENLEGDPYLHGGGINSYPTGGTLDLHIDYRIHPHSKKERRINLLIYLSDKDWQEAWGGATELWDSTFGKQDPQPEPMRYPPVGDAPISSAAPIFNRALIFATEDYSWHAVQPITCPAGKIRRTFNVYYISEPRPDVTQRFKAFFAARPNDATDSLKDRLRLIRLVRRLNEDDSREYFKSLKGPASDDHQ